MSDNTPLISCLTVTKDLRRAELLRKSIDCFARQTWPNRELVILSDGSPEYAREIDRLVENYGSSDLRHVYRPGDRSLGAARNLCVAEANGDFLCQWDDDDLYHPARLEVQFRHMESENAEASLMADQWQYFSDTREFLWLNWYPDLIPGTLLCGRACLARHPYPDRSLEEDAAIRQELREDGSLAILRGKGWLYLYTWNGLNAWPRSHHEHIRVNHDPGFIIGRIEIVEQYLPAYGLDIRDLTLLGAEGENLSRAAPNVSPAG